MKTTTSNTKNVLELYSELSWTERSLIRELAVQSLLDDGKTKIGPIDINCSIEFFYNKHSSFEDIINNCFF